MSRRAEGAEARRGVCLALHLSFIYSRNKVVKRKLDQIPPAVFRVKAPTRDTSVPSICPGGTSGTHWSPPRLQRAHWIGSSLIPPVPALPEPRSAVGSRLCPLARVQRSLSTVGPDGQAYFQGGRILSGFSRLQLFPRGGKSFNFALLGFSCSFSVKLKLRTCVR